MSASVDRCEIGASFASHIELATHMLETSRAARKHLPRGFHTATPLDIMLDLFVSATNPLSKHLADVGLADGMHVKVAERWIAALVEEGLVVVQIDRIFLSRKGSEAVMLILEDIAGANQATGSKPDRHLEE